jgi:hypothetical protein
VKRIAREQPAARALADVPLGLVVRRDGCGADDVEPELVRDALQGLRGHVRGSCMLAARIHEDGAPRSSWSRMRPILSPGLARCSSGSGQRRSTT